HKDTKKTGICAFVFSTAKMVALSRNFTMSKGAPPVKHTLYFVIVFCALMIVTQSASAHFRLLEPASWLIESDRGDPQKAGTCGGSNTDWGKPSYIVTNAIGGQKLHIKIQETISHPGHYRVALAVNSPTELPMDPQVTTRDTERGPQSVSAAIQNPIQIPVLA